MEIKLFDKIIMNTDWNYETTIKELQKQKNGVNVIMTGARYLLVNTHKFKLFWLESSVFGYELNFKKREAKAKLESIVKYWNIEYEKKHGLKKDVVIWKDEDG